MKHTNKVPLEDKNKCIICGVEFKTIHTRNKHLKQEHGLTFKQYILSQYYDNIIPTCKCGCGEEMKFISTPFGVFFKDYKANHKPKKAVTDETKLKMRLAKLGNTHIVTIKHLKLHSYFCNVCGKECNTIKSLYNHIRIHGLNKKTYHIQCNSTPLLYKCDVCGKRKTPITQQYCSTTCKHKANGLRFKKTKNTTQLKCNICGVLFNDISNISGHVTSHLKYKHNINDSEYMNYMTLQDKQKVFKCPYCDYTTIDLNNDNGSFTKHLKNVHNLTYVEHLKKYPEHSSFWKTITEKEKHVKFIKDNKTHQIQCKLCGKYYGKINNVHLKTHGLTVLEYKKKYGVPNTCSTGYIDIHRKKSTEHILNNPHNYNRKTSKLEIDFKNKMEFVDIKHEPQYAFNGKKYDFLLTDLDILVEIDGTFHHPKTLNNLTIQQISSVLNDVVKIDDVSKSKYKLYKIHWDESMNFNNEQELIALLNGKSYLPDYSLSYRQNIIPKEYFIKYIENKGVDKLERYIPLLLKFIRTFQPAFPLLPQEESLNGVISIIQNYDLDRIYIPSEKTFKNNIYSIGNNILKSNFRSYWNSSYKGNKTPTQAWYDDDLMVKIIKYRIGINNSSNINEVFNFSLYQLINGLSANRLLVSFFKPLLASSIYAELLGNNETPTVFDPCCGFGGRMLGFISKYPSGTYIGLEPNIDTYNELLWLKKQLTIELDLRDNQIQLYNCKFEDFTTEIYYDILFTSIPYYDLETYSNEVVYNGFEVWKELFFDKFYEYDNCYINLNNDLCEQLDLTNNIAYNIRNNQSHFNKTKNIKCEVICKL